MFKTTSERNITWKSFVIETVLWKCHKWKCNLKTLHRLKCMCAFVWVCVCMCAYVCVGVCVCVTDGRTGLNTTLTFLTESHSTQYISSHEGITEDPLELKIN